MSSADPDGASSATSPDALASPTPIASRDAARSEDVSEIPASRASVDINDIPEIHGAQNATSPPIDTLNSDATPSPIMPDAVRDGGIVREPIAIIGMSANFPGAPDAAALWTLLEQGLNTVSEPCVVRWLGRAVVICTTTSLRYTYHIPASRFAVDDYTSGAHGAGRTLKTRVGNFLADADVFDHAFFRVSPREARSMSPQQRLLLHAAYHALEHAGCVPGGTRAAARGTFGTYVGAATNDYVQNLRRDVDVYYSTGTLQAFLSGKIAYAFGLGGPSVVVDTSCSASMVALHTACRALQSGDCNAALAGGVNVISSPDMYLGLDRAHFLSPTGQCKPWDAAADGYARAEGVALFVLKRLADARADGDRVLGVIKSIEVNQSACARSITHPHAPTQAALLRRALAAARVHPQDVQVVEAHGTGTRAGDPAELAALRSVLCAAPRARPLLLGSAKANLGHAEAASGGASLAKLLLMLRHGAVPRCVSLKNPNPALGLTMGKGGAAGGGVFVPTQSVRWERGQEGRRTAVLSNFGAAGSNVVLVLQEDEPPSPSPSPPPTLVMGLSADSLSALESRRAAYIAHLEGADAAGLADAAYTATARRQVHRFRLGATGASKEELLEALGRAEPVHVDSGSPNHYEDDDGDGADEERGDGEGGGEGSGEGKAKVVWIFSGQGAQHAGMGRELMEVKAFRDVVVRCEDWLRAWGRPGVRAVIEGADSGADGAEELGIEAGQTAVFVLECALAALWRAWGVRPDAVAGHSLGEYAALVAAGVLGLEDGLRLVSGRARLMDERCVRGESGMLAVRAPVGEVERWVGAEGYRGLSVACYNSPEDTVVAGPLAQLDALQAALKAAQRKCTRVAVPFAFHTPAMAPVLADLTALASSVPLHAPRIPVLSNVHGTLVPPADASVFTPAYFAAHCAAPVQFTRGIAALRADPAFSSAALLELGPHPTCLPMLRAGAPGALLLPSLRKNLGAWGVLGESLARLYTSAVEVDWRAVFKDLAPGARITDLPAYPFAQTRFWVPYEEHGVTEKAEVHVEAPPRFSLLGKTVKLPRKGEEGPAVFETPLATLAPLVDAHRVAGHALCPASVHIELASAAALLLFEARGAAGADSVVVLKDVAFPGPLVYAPDVPRVVRVEVAPTAPHAAAFAISSYAAPEGKHHTHCTGTLALASARATAAKFALAAPLVARRAAAAAAAPLAETFSARTAYDRIFARVVAYGPAFRTMRAVTLAPDGADACAAVAFPAEHARVPGAYAAHPVFVDTLLHAAGFVANCSADAHEAYICASVGKVRVLPALVEPERSYSVYCALGALGEGAVCAEAWALDAASGELVAVLKRAVFRRLRLSGFAAVLASAARGAPGVSPRPTHRTQLSTASSRVDQVRAVLASVLGLPEKEIAEDDDLARLGLDSLTAIEAHHALCAALRVRLPDGFLAACTSVAAICAALDALDAPDAHDAHDAPAPARSGASTPSGSERTLHEPEAEGANADAAAVPGVLARVLGLAPAALPSDADLARLGMDSLMAIEAQHALEAALGRALPGNLFVTCRTVRAVQDAVAPMKTGPWDAAPQLKDALAMRPPTFGTEANPVLLQEGTGGGAPLFLVHDGSGLAHQYARLAPLGREVWGVHNPRFADGGAWAGGVLEMARVYAGLVKGALNGRARCLVGGWSFGGVVAFEVARQLIAAGTQVAALVLIDAPHPATSTPLSPEALDAAFANKGASSAANERARACIQAATAALVAYDPSASPVAHASPARAVMLRCREAFAFAGSTPPSASDRFLADRKDPRAIVRGWEDVLGVEVPVFDIPGNHFEPFLPRNVGQVSNALVEVLQPF
ncbi:polyketide synthase [Phanerochaete sordida]|uniref:Polyketide synthase n=1 Tax=Phanerochaete sordida TaxID=48140 RepID=A0A9P3GMR1_9APHY|nr:polyketide synthase [Phanerochaete sordida]